MVEISSCSLFRSSHKITNFQAKITNIAKEYQGVPYRNGGNDFSGIDCSGLLCNVFKEIGMKIPRISWQQAEFFPTISKTDIQTGDLVFFITNGGNYINHAGIVTEVRGKDEVVFISASSSRGVIEDKLFSNYWRNKLAKVARPFMKM